MIIYIEDVIVQNFTTSYFITQSANAYCSVRKNRIQSVLCGIIAVVVVFCSLTFYKWQTIVRLMGIIAQISVFIIKKRKKIMSIIVFAIALFISFAITNLLSNIMSVFVCKTVPKILTVFPILGATLLRLLSIITKNSQEKSKNRYPISLTIWGKKFNLEGFLDTGNRLVDNVTGLAVIVLNLNAILYKFDQQTVFNLLRQDALKLPNTRCLKYHTVGKKDLCMLITKPDEFIIEIDGKKVTKECMIGISTNIFTSDFDVILHSKLIQ